MSNGERGSSIEVLHLLDRLEALVSGGTRVPLTSRSLVDEQEFIDVLDQIRAAIPEEVRQAKRVSQEKDKVILQAQSEADKILAAAREQATAILQEDALVREAEIRAEAMIQDAIDRAEEISRGADEYALAALDRLEDELNRLLVTVRKGKATLERSLAPHAEASGDDFEPVDGRSEPSRLR